MKIDNSMLRCYADCNTKAMLQYVLNRQPKVESDAAWFGQQFHKFVEYYWQPTDKWKQVAIEYEQKVQDFYKKQLESGKFFENDSIKPEVYLNCIRQFADQIPRIISPEGEVVLLEKTTMQPTYVVKYKPEIGAQIPLAGHEYCGRLDTLVEDFNGVLYIIDVKTTSKYRRDKKTGEAVAQFTWAEGFRMTTQFTGYIEILSQHTTKPIGGALILAIPRVKDKLRISTIPILRTQRELEEWKNDTTKLIHSFIEDAKNTLKIGKPASIPTGKYNGACNRFGICPFFDVCKSHFNPQIIEQTTEYRVWNPLSPEEDENE